MFNSVAQHPERAPLARIGTVVLSALAHVAVVAVVIVSTLFATGTLPAPPDMMVFVAAVPPPPPPPPAPPLPQQPVKAAPQVASRPAPIVTTPQVMAPVEAPAAIAPETGREAEVFAPVVAGFETASSNGVVGGITDGLDLAPPPAPVAAIRVGGAVKAPKLIRRVEPDYPSMAAQAQMEGMVILEATVDEGGNVDAVKVLKSQPIFDAAAIASVKQWQYEPLMMNGQATPFVLTVTLSFSLTR